MRNIVTSNYIQFISMIMLSLFVLSGCNSNLPESLSSDTSAIECIEADDWGDPKINVSSYKMLEKSKGETISNQYMPWVDSGQVILSASRIPLIMSIRPQERWTSWYGGLVDSNKICQFTTENSCPTLVKSQGLSLNCLQNGKALSPPDMVADCLVPCWINHGMGLYMLSGANPERVVYKTRVVKDLKRSEYDSDEDYNKAVREYYAESTRIQSSRGVDLTSTIDANYLSTPNPLNSDDSITIHLGGTANTSNITPETRQVFLTRDIPVDINDNLETGHRLYFKIMDTFYADNAGGYQVRIHSGTRSATPGPLEFAVGTFESVVNLAAEMLYRAVVKNYEFVLIVQALLILYIAIYGFKFMFGMDNTHNVGTFVMHVFKVAILIQLIAPSSWEFFYVYLFRIFTEGVTGLLGMLASPFAVYDPVSPWYTLDMMLERFFSDETWLKISSLFFSHPFIGVFIVVGITMAIVIFLFALIAALLSYLQAYLTMGFLLILFPIMLIFIVLERTKWFFEEWLKQMVAIAIEMILLFGALGLFSILIMGFFEKNLGYRVCWMPIFGAAQHGQNALIPRADMLHSLIPWGIFLPNVSNMTGEVYVGSDPSSGAPLVETRYIDAPYLDTENVERDAQQFEKVKNTRMYFINPLDVIPLLLALYLTLMFIKNVLPSLKANLRGAIAGATDSAGALGSGIRSSINNLVFGTRPQNSNPTTLVGAAGKYLRGNFTSGVSGAANALTGGIDGGKGLTGFLSGAGDKSIKAQVKHTGRRGGLLGGIVSAYKTAQYTVDELEGVGKDREAEKAHAAAEGINRQADEAQKEDDFGNQTQQQNQAAASTERVDENEGTGRAGSGRSALERHAAVQAAAANLQSFLPAGTNLNSLSAADIDKMANDGVIDHSQAQNAKTALTAYQQEVHSRD